jgi:hypothetical protein
LVQSRTWYVCLYEFWLSSSSTSSSSVNALSSATITYDAQPPSAPTLTLVTAGDQHLKVSFDSSDDSDISEYRILIALKSTDSDEQVAASAADGGDYLCYPGARSFSAGTETGGVSVPSSNDLTDGLTYVVQVEAVDSTGNVGPCSNPKDGTPRLI